MNESSNLEINKKTLLFAVIILHRNEKGLIVWKPFQSHVIRFSTLYLVQSKDNQQMNSKSSVWHADALLIIDVSGRLYQVLMHVFDSRLGQSPITNTKIDTNTFHILNSLCFT